MTDEIDAPDATPDAIHRDREQETIRMFYEWLGEVVEKGGIRAIPAGILRNLVAFTLLKGARKS